MAIDEVGNAVRWQDGHWSKPQPIDIGHHMLAIGCASDRSCAAVDYGDASRTHLATRAIRYVHGHWQRPQRIDTDGISAGVSCAAASFCVVLEVNRGRLVTFEHGSWSAPKYLRYAGSDVDCVAPARCFLSGHRVTRVLRGHTWHKVPTPSGFGGVDCVDAAFCLGAYDTDASSGAAELHAGVWGRLAVRAGLQACASRTFCIAEAYSKPNRQGSKFEETFNGSAVRTSIFHATNSLVCAAGPLCIELTKYSARVGRP
jgi:hypothetical protein